jgi:hypothetical protein
MVQRTGGYQLWPKTVCNQSGFRPCSAKRLLEEWYRF